MSGFNELLKDVERRDELYPCDFTKKAEYKLANLMKHGYELADLKGGVRLERNDDILIILPNGEVFKKAIY